MALLRRHDHKIDALARVSLFAGLSKKELGEIARFVTEVQFVPGEHLGEEGELGRQALVLLTGTASVRKKGRKVAVLSSGDVVGEMSLVTRQPRNATVTAETEVAALVMDPREFAAVMEGHPKVAVKILRTVAERLVEAVPPLN
jgi:CRP/FNR family cyclic AMP-dependent transcriptional regulator